MKLVEIQGICPACKYETLQVAVGGYVICSFGLCPDPTMVADMLDNKELGDLLAAVAAFREFRSAE